MICTESTVPENEAVLYHLTSVVDRRPDPNFYFDDDPDPDPDRQQNDAGPHANPYSIFTNV